MREESHFYILQGPYAEVLRLSSSDSLRMTILVVFEARGTIAAFCLHAHFKESPPTPSTLICSAGRPETPTPEKPPPHSMPAQNTRPAETADRRRKFR